jgi:hypothetical protein
MNTFPLRAWSIISLLPASCAALNAAPAPAAAAFVCQVHRIFSDLTRVGFQRKPSVIKFWKYMDIKTDAGAQRQGFAL